MLAMRNADGTTNIHDKRDYDIIDPTYPDPPPTDEERRLVIELRRAAALTTSISLNPAYNKELYKEGTANRRVLDVVRANWN